jgi:hypothetical protein
MDLLLGIGLAHLAAIALCLVLVKILSRRCPECHSTMPRHAPRCWTCGHRPPRVRMTTVLLLVGCWATSAAAEDGARWLDCQGLSFFSNACVEVVLLPATPETSPASALPPLFRKEEMAADTPALLLHLLREPTADNAARYKAWHLARQRRMAEVEQLLRTTAPDATER